MELLKLDESLVEYPWNDVTFYIKPRLSSRDKWNVVTSGKKMVGDKVEFSPWDYYITMIKTFVVKWKGVTVNGAEVPFSFEALEQLPCSPDDNLIMQLGLFIAKTLGFIQDEKETDLKNG